MNHVTTDMNEIILKVGFEIHQQLSTQNKLFCNCKCLEVENYDSIFLRKLRPAHSELGSYDRASIFEFTKMRTIKYHSSYIASCLVEADEEPPHEINRDAMDTALIISLALNSNIIDEINVMRKIVIDGSNTSGFQRTMLISYGGHLQVDGKKIGVQTICLEEDSGKLLSDDGRFREYGLDRLGIPLIEIALEPVTGTPTEVVKIALTLGRLLRTTKRVARGLGSIRQDVNISVNNGKGVVEIKGVQRLDQLIKVIKYETIRQHGLILIAEKMNRERKSNDIIIGDKIMDITNIFRDSSSKIVQKVISNKGNILVAIRVKGFKGLFGFEPYPDIRIGKELGELVRFYGFGGLFHSDELPNYGITDIEVKKVNEILDIDISKDGFIILGGPREKMSIAISAICDRLNSVSSGVPSETRAARIDGKTIYSRPKPGSARMYPETDITPFKIRDDLLVALKEKVPKSWNETISYLAKKYQLNKNLAEKIFDSNYFEIFEVLCGLTKISPSFIASKLTEDILNLERQGYDSSILNNNILLDIFKRLDSGLIAKESVNLIMEKLMNRTTTSVDESIRVLGIKSISDEELETIIDKIIQDNILIIQEKGIKATSTLMGKCMTILRGKVDGKKINDLINNKLNIILNLKK
ncbi:MAG TPA: Glu-tRNA(Gln) amidotransferase subunit GatE [Nitrososphaeraceae archaeon]|nr:Glu-tRNA(Gln) amidotransferase subunit GatE [Nitrososphaeraceae archaeon]